MIRDIGLRVSSDLKNLSVALIKSQLLESENWKIVGSAGDDVIEIVSKKTDYNSDISMLDILKAHDCFYKHTKEYVLFDRTGDYTFKLLDGSLIQVNYLFNKNKLVKQRMSYFQKPYKDEEINFLDNLYNENPNSTPYEAGLVWLRFDFDPDKGTELFHPKAHLTVSNFKNCRIPVSSPMTAKQFITMIVLNFYENKYQAYIDQLKKSTFLENTYPESFFKKEKTNFRVHTGG